MPNGMIVQLLMVWIAVWVLFALRGVLHDALGHAVRRRTPGPYLFGVASIVLIWTGQLIAVGQRIHLDVIGLNDVPVSRTAIGHLVFGLFIVSGWCACRIGLPTVLWRGKAWLWRIFNVGAAVLILAEVLI